MTRSIDPVPHWVKGGEPVALGEMYFFESGTNTPKATFADSEETIVNTHPVILDGEGNLPNVFFTGIAKQRLTKPSPFTQGDGRGDQVFSRDPVGQQASLVAFDSFTETTIYQLNSIVTTSDGRFWKSLGNDNVGNSPIGDDGSKWQQIDFKEFYAQGVIFSKLESTISVIDGLTYISVVDNNLGNEPSGDNGSNWVLDNPVLDWVIGKEYFIGEQAYSLVDLRRYASQLVQGGNEPSVDVGTNWLPIDGVVNKPVNISPADLATDISRLPTLVTDAYSVSGSSNAQEYSIFELSDDSFSTVLYTSDITNDLTSHTVTDQLESATTYSYRMVKKGVRTDISEFSDVTTFTTNFPLSDSFSNDLDFGTAAARTLVNGVDLSTKSGFVLIANLDTTDPMRFCSTPRGPGVASHVGVELREQAEPTGLTSFNVNGYSVGADTAYNGSGDNIYSLVFQQIEKLIDIVQYTGNSTNRVLTHNLGDVPGTYICIELTGATDENKWYMRISAETPSEFTIRFGFPGSATTIASVFTSTPATSTEISLGSGSANRNGREYIALIFGNDVSAGIRSGTYTGTAAGGNKIVTVFAPSTIFIFRANNVAEPHIICDLVLGTSNHVVLTSTAEIGVGSVQSFDTDGFTLSSSLANDSGVPYYYIAIADPGQF